MALIPHPCYQDDQFRFNTDTSKVELLLAPGGGLTYDTAGLKLSPLGAQVPSQHYGVSHKTFVLTGSINAGILAPAGPGPVSTALVGDPITNSFSRPAYISTTASFNGVLLPPTALSSALLHLDVTFDGVVWNRVATIGYFSDDGTQRAGFYTMQETVILGLAPGFSATPQFLLLYENVYAGAAMIQASVVKVESSIHTI